MSRNLLILFSLLFFSLPPITQGAEKRTHKSIHIKKLTQQINFFIEKKNYLAALNTNSQLLKLDPKNRFALKQSKLLSQIVFEKELKNAASKEKKGDLEGAHLAYTKALSIQNNATIKKKTDELNKLLKSKKEKESEAIYLKALEAFQKGDTKKASVLCEQALIVNPNNIYAQKMSGKLKFRINHSK
ncbi:MAG: hypothetical protein ACKVQC_04055 [Elusimicrobiota bacterium]